MNELTQKCSVCAAPCCALGINNHYLCDSHFDAWLKWPYDERGCGQRMAEFLADAKAQARRSA
jgi:hypothetical protein